jgi:hypothetical protein
MQGQNHHVQAAVDALGFIGWTLARDKYDNFPRSFAGDWDDLIAFIDSHRAPRKGLNGLAGLFANDGRRCLDNALPRHFLPFDLDGDDGAGVPDNVFERQIDAFQGIEAVAYETASSKPNARKARIMVRLSRGITDRESRALGGFISGLTGISGWDASVYMLSQVCYLPPLGSKLIRIEGEPLDVDVMLARIPKLRPKKMKRGKFRPAEDLRGFFAQNGLILREADSVIHVRCPWVNEHTGGDQGGTAYFEPSPQNGFAGGFKCLHAHCQHRSVKDIHRLAKGVV